MKTICSTIICLVMSCTMFAQIGKKNIGKNLPSVISVKPSGTKLNKKLPRSFDINKLSKLNVPQSKMKLPSRKKVKITPIRPYNPNMDITFKGKYSKNYFAIADILYGGLVIFNAQKGKEYRMKIALADRNHLLRDFNTDYPNGRVAIYVGSYEEGYSMPVSQSNRELSFLFRAAQAGKIQIALYGIISDNWKWGDDFWLPIKSIQVDEI